MGEEYWKQEYHLVTGEFQKLEDKLNAAMKVVDAARKINIECYIGAGCAGYLGNGAFKKALKEYDKAIEEQGE